MPTNRDQSLCTDLVLEYDAERIQALREKLQLNQTVMTSVLNVSAFTIRKREVSDMRPSGPSVKFLSLLDRKELDALM